jgi:hypothetical protein
MSYDKDSEIHIREGRAVTAGEWSHAPRCVLMKPYVCETCGGAAHYCRVARGYTQRACVSCAKARATIHYKGQPTEWKVKEVERKRGYKFALREEMLVSYGHKCQCCGESHSNFLSIDHIGGGGNQHRKSLGMKSGSDFYLWLKRASFPKDKFRLLCHNCNSATSHGRACPHRGGDGKFLRPTARPWAA